MYNNILNGILRARHLNEVNLQVAHIKSLRPIARDLWDSYQTQNVSTQYTSNYAQDCYLLRYYPVYTGLLSQELAKISTELEETYDDLYLTSFFGCGPAPELVSLLNFLRDARPLAPEMVQANLFDIAAEPWEYARNIAINYIIPDVWDPDLLDVHSYISDFTSEDFWKGSLATQKTVTNSKLVVFQNCLNEVRYKQYKQTLDNIQKIIEHLTSGSVIVFIDQEKGKYRSSDSVLNSINAMAEASDSVSILKEYGDHCFNCYAINSDLPSMVRDKLYYLPQRIDSDNNKLILRKTIGYSSLIIKRL